MTIKGVAAAGVALLMGTAPAFAEDAPAAAAPAPAPLAQPTFAGPMSGNTAPFNFDIDGFGKIYVNGFASGVVSTQSNSVYGDNKSYADVANAQIVVQKVDGLFQFYVQAGLYSFPSIGFPYLRSGTTTENTYGPVPQAWIKLAPSAAFNIQVGILPSPFGVEPAFTYQNMNIDRGLLWGQENVFARGVQGNLTLGKLSLALSLNDGFFSGKYNWVTGSAAYAFDSTNTLSFVAGGATSKKYKSTLATPLYLNNSSIYNIIYTYTSGPLMIQPYFQYTHVPTLQQTFDDGEGGTLHFTSGAADTYSGAILARYNFTPNFAIPVRFEYIDTKAKTITSPNLLYGPGSNAFTFTITPTYTYKALFARLEFNVVKASQTTPGGAFGTDGTNQSQTRGLAEIGFIF